MIDQTVLFTIIPRGITLQKGASPVSVIVSPRLRGSDQLGSFPDWLNWTEKLKSNGLTLVILCGPNVIEVPIDRPVLQPRLWAALFKEDTYVRSHEFPDYTDRGLQTYSMRSVLSAIKGIYQSSAVDLALPEEAGMDRRKERGNRAVLAGKLKGLAVHWDGQQAKEWRAHERIMNRETLYVANKLMMNQGGSSPLIDEEGLYITAQGSVAQSQAARSFAVYHHMPTPAQAQNPVQIDENKALDFHQVISSLNSYPALLRSLGLVFDLELPAWFVADTPAGGYGKLSVGKVLMNWETTTRLPETETAYINLPIGANRIFMTAPLALEDPATPFNAIGLVGLNPDNFGLAQVDVDGALHKAIITAETFNPPDPNSGEPARNLFPKAAPEPAPNPEIYDRDATLPALRSGGFSLYADRKGALLFQNMTQSKAFSETAEKGQKQPRPFFAEDLLRGYRIDVWDSHTNSWHSLHRRTGIYTIGEETYAPEGEEEGFVQSAAMQPAPGAAAGPDGSDLYVHETIARWSGWSLSVPTPGKHLSRYGDPDKAVPPDNDPAGDYLEDQPITPFKMTVDYRIVKGSLPRLAFGRRYRLRARYVDLAGNSLAHDDPLAHVLSLGMGLPRGPEGRRYLRFEPVNAPQIVIREAAALTEPGSAVDRLVIRTWNDGIANDAIPADTTAADRHLLPPRISVEMGEQLGMFDDNAGKLKSDPATWQLIAARDAGELNQAPIAIAGGAPQTFPVEPGEIIAALPYLPDPLAEGAALRDLPGTPQSVLARVGLATAAGSIPCTPLSGVNPRPGSATLISFDGGNGWMSRAGIRLALAEPAPDQAGARPHWDPDGRCLTVYLPKGEIAIVPLSSFQTPEGLELMGQWSWLRQYIELITLFAPQPQYLQPGAAVDRINHILQRVVEGGHWMLNPPLLLTLVHAVQQPLGEPRFVALNVDHKDDPPDMPSQPEKWQTAAARDESDPIDMSPMTAWRGFGATDAHLLGGLKIHAPSSGQIDLLAEWSEPVDDVSQESWQMVSRAAHVETIPVPAMQEGYLEASGKEHRLVGYYDSENGQIAFVRKGDRGGPVVDGASATYFLDAAPRHQFNDSRRRKVSYTAVASSRYREYFPGDATQEENGLAPLDFTRRSAPIVVDVPASARPLAPTVQYVLPTFGWQRQMDTNIRRSVRFGGGLRVYMDRPWFSSGEGELLGVALWSGYNGSLNEATRDRFKPYFTQWGMDPIWQSASLGGVPSTYNFPNAVAQDYKVALEERSARSAGGNPGWVNVVGFPANYDPERKLWFADLTVQPDTDTYMPFVRLALVRYQPHALPEARISRVTLADFAQITPGRSALVTVHPDSPGQLRVVISGVAPRGPGPVVQGRPSNPLKDQRPTRIRVRVQVNPEQIASDLAWRDLAAPAVQVSPLFDGYPNEHPDLAMWAGLVTFAPGRPPGAYRLLIEEHENLSANYTVANQYAFDQPGRLIYAEAIALEGLLGEL